MRCEPYRSLDHANGARNYACFVVAQTRGHEYQNAVRHAAGAFKYIEDVVHPGSLAGIQAILLIVIYSMFDPHHLKSWNLIGLASRAMVDIGLHQDPPADVPLKGTDHEISRRLYASIYYWKGQRPSCVMFCRQLLKRGLLQFN